MFEVGSGFLDPVGLDEFKKGVGSDHDTDLISP
jgi:hypothetical protein